MSSNHRIADQIHTRALEVASRYKRAEADLIEILQLAEKHEVHHLRGHSSLYNYAISELGLSENIAYNLITVARKAIQVPELKTQLEAGTLTLTNARRVASVLTPENQSEWIEKATSLSSRELEKEIAKVRPQEATPERTSYVSDDRLKLELGISEEELENFKRARDIICQSRKRQASLEETLKVMTAEFLERHDPVQKAARHQARKEKAAASESDGKKLSSYSMPALVARRENSHRKPLPATIRHQINLRDKRRCQHVLSSGLRCRQSRWVEIHHKIPVYQGGKDIPANLITLCSAHHRLIHMNESVMINS
jgi:hypothetical protein